VPAGLGPATESDAPAEGQAEEVLLDENRRKEEGKHSFYMVGDTWWAALDSFFCFCCVMKTTTM
jgi:hypothetical protein